MSNKKLDLILKHLKTHTLKSGANTLHTELTKVDIAEALDINYTETSRLLEKLVEDKYVIRNDMDFEDKGTYTSFSLNPSYVDFKGYETEYAKKENLSEIGSEKIWYETGNARKQFESYSSTRIMAIIACIVSVILLFLKIIELAKR